MNKTKLTLAVLGGVIGLIVLVMLYMDWSAFSAKTVALEGDDEGTDGLETVIEKAEKLSRKPIYPCLDSVKKLDTNRAEVAAWEADAVKLIIRGDKTFAKTTPAAFKTFLSSEAQRLMDLPGGTVGKVMRPEFTFGPFKEFVLEGKMPTEAQLPELQRQWDDIATVIAILSQSGIVEVQNITLNSQKPEGDQQAQQPRKQAGKAKKGGKEEKAESGVNPVTYNYTFTFTTRPPALVKVLNALATCPRFITVDSFTLSRAKDQIAEALGTGEKKSAALPTGGRRGRRARQQAEETEEESASKGGIVTDPLLDDPVSIAMTVTVYDFGQAVEAAPEAEKTEEASK